MRDDTIRVPRGGALSGNIRLKRVLLIGFFVVLLVMGGVPPLIGGQIHNRQQVLLDRLSLVVAGAEPTLESYQKGWFTSRTRHRLLLSDARLAAAAQMLADPAGSSPAAALIIDTVIAHGPWPMLDGWPALARMRSTLLLEGSEAEQIPLPGVAVTRVGFGGGGHTRVTVDELLRPLADGQGTLSAQGADIDVRFDRNAARLRTRGVLRPVRIESAEGLMESGRLTFSSDTRPTGFGFRSGSSQVAMETFVFVDYLGREVSGSGLDLALQVSADNDTVDYATHVGLARIQAQGGAPVAANMDLRFEALDAVMLGALLQRVQQGFGLRPFGTELASLVRPGSGLRVSDLEIRAGEGYASLDLQLQLPARKRNRQTDNNSFDLLSLFEGDGQLRMNRIMLSTALGLKPGALDPREGSDNADPIGLISQGYLRVEGDKLVSDLRISGGLITVNKLPLPLSP